jgi:polyisoprenoid-binding protein YceI
MEDRMSKWIGAARGALLAAAMATAGVGAAGAQALPPGVFAGEHDFHQAPAGTYALDPNHAGVIARVSHIGYSYSVFRFDKVAGTLTWDPAAPEKSALSVTVQTGSIATNVAGFASELSGKNFLNVAAFPQATFVSTTFRRTDADHGKVDGQFTLMGKTVPMTFDVTLVGAGKGFMGHPRIGAHAEGVIDPKAFGLPPMFSAPIDLVIDTEFSKN